MGKFHSLLFARMATPSPAVFEERLLLATR